ncbi:MAG: tyrosine-type recombinase/integrase [Thiotrichales bacterium]|nr:tyrosine-type recombinase/integrase [Thiotrichales bacterium]
MMTNKLSSAFVAKTKKAGRHADGNGLYLHVEPSGSRRWVQRLVIRGKRRELGLGGYPLVTLAEARTVAIENRKMARAGGDPLAAKRVATGIPTFAEATARVFELRRPGWRSARHAEQWIGSLNEYAMPKLGAFPVDGIDAADILTVLTPLWHTMPVTAQRLRQRIGTVLKWAIAQGWRLDNPADAIAYALPRQSRRPVHQASLHYTEVADAVAEVRDTKKATPAVKLALEFMVLTAARSGEVTGATWSEIDLEAATWTVPPERMKGNRPHRVPLSDRALEVLAEARELGNGCELVFPGPKTGRPMFRARFSRLLKQLGIPAVPHGFRSSFRDWAAERTDAPHAVMEAALAHVNPNKAEAAYARSDLFERRRELMEWWARYLNPALAPVVSLDAHREAVR